MKRCVFLSMLTACILLALLAAFVLTSPVYAQDEAPSEVPPEVVPEEILAEELAPAEVPVEVPGEVAGILDEASEAGVTLVDESGEPLAFATEEAAEALASGDPWYKIGTGKYIFVLSPAICPDPLPAGVVYCEASTTPIQAAVTQIGTTGLPSDGLIYIEADTYPNDNLNIVVASDPILAGFKGFIGEVVDGLPGVIMTFGRIHVEGVTSGFTVTGFDISTSTIYAAISIADSSGPIKIQDVDLHNSSASGHGLEVINHNGSVTITRAKVSGNAGGGAYIENLAGTKGVTITNSAFEENQLFGLQIISNGKVTINGISASDNHDMDGANISAQGGLDIRNSVFNNNTAVTAFEGNGLDARDNLKGNITLINVVANGNEQHGIYVGTRTGTIIASGLTAAGNLGYFGASLDTCYADAGDCTTTSANTISITNSDFLDNALIGLSVISRGKISASFLNASDNVGSGAEFRTSGSQLSNPTVTINRSIFGGNDGQGLVVWSKGSVTVDNITVDDNGSGSNTSGAWIGTSSFTASIYVKDGYGPNIFSNTNGVPGFDNQGGHGLMAISYNHIEVHGATAEGNSVDGFRLDNSFHNGNIKVNRCSASGNGRIGLEATSTGTITVTDSSFIGNTVGNAYLNNVSDKTTTPAVTILRGNFDDSAQGYGLNVISDGAINLTDSRANENVAFGAMLDNSTGSAGVSILYKKLTNHFDANGENGIEIVSNGNVVIKSAIVMGNDGMGALIDNCRYLDVACRGKGSVSITGSSFYINHGYGLLALSKGAITLSDVSARFTVDGTGAYLVNNYPGATAGISVTGSSKQNPREFSDNGSSGLVILTNGSVTVKNADLIENDGWGLNIQNQAGAVILSSLYLTDNGLVDIRDGIYIETLGAVTITDSVSAYSGRNGAMLLNYLGSGNVSIKNSQFNLNHGTGLVIRSAGLVSMTNVDAWSNDFYSIDYPGYGVDIDNTWGTAGVTLYAPTTAYPADYNLYFDNAAEGLHILTRGAVSLAKIDAHENGGDGVQVENLDLTLMKPVSVVNSLLTANTHHGITILTGGALTFTGNTASGNSVYGASLDNCAYVDPVCQSTAVMTIKNSHFDGNTNSGLSAFSGGNVLLDKVSANGSVNGSGAGINVSVSSIATTTVMVQRSQFNDNRYDGLVVTGRGTITVNAVEASRNMALESMNPRGGMILDNYTFGTGKIQVLSSLGANIFNDNARYGLAAFSNGAISVSKVTSQRNGSHGLYLMGYTDASNVTLSDGNLRMNTNSGVYISTYGTITLTRLISLNNGTETDWDGATLYSHGKIITITKSAFHGNGWYGIYANAGASIPVTISKTSWFGNGPIATPDLWWLGTLILVP